MHASRRWLRLALLGGLTVLAFGLRAYRLDAQSYWIDEGWTLYYAGLSPEQLWQTLQTTRIVPPLYHFLTLYWSGLVGNGEYAMRFISLVCGVLSVPLTYCLGRTLGGARLGTIGALLMTVAPYQVWHAQDARNYTMLVAASGMSMWGFVGLLKAGSPSARSRAPTAWAWRWGLLYILGTEWALLTHYHAVILIGVQGLVMLITGWRRVPEHGTGDILPGAADAVAVEDRVARRFEWHWRLALRWGALLAVVLALFGVWLYFGLGSLKSYLNWIPQPTLWETYARGAVAYSVGELVPFPQSLWVSLAFVALFVLGLAHAARSRWGGWRGRDMLAFASVYTLAPNLAAWLYGELRTPVYLERYLIPVQVGYLLVVAMGILAVAEGARHALRRNRIWVRTGAAVVAAAPLLLVVGVGGWVLGRHYFDPAYAKPDWRTIAHTIQDHAVPGDAIIITGDGSDRVFSFYYQGQAPIYLDFNTPAPPPERAIERLAEIAAEHRRIWYTPYGVEIDTVLEDWLARQAYPAWQSWIARQRLALYATAQPAALTQDNAGSTHLTDVAFADAAGDGVRLTSVAAPTRAAAGDVVPLTLTWVANASLGRNYQMSLRLINERDDRFVQADWPPLAAAGATMTWHPGEAVTDRRGLWLPADVPPGDYSLEIAVYDADTGQSLGTPQRVAPLQLMPAERVVPLRSLSIPHPIRLALGEVTVVGYALPERLQPGQDLVVWLYWQATPPEKVPLADATLRLSLVNPDLAAEPSDALVVIGRLSESVGSLADWRAGQVRRAVFHLPTGPRLTGDQAALRLTLTHDAGDEQMAQLPSIALQQRVRQWSPPRVAQTAEVDFGDPPTARLIGFDVPGRSVIPGSELAVTLHWRALAEMDANYTVFVQMLSADWRVVAQVDRPPLDGTAPTNTWLVGEYLSDPYRLRLPADLAPGVYHVIAGLYAAQTGRRLPVSSGGDFVDLGAVEIGG
jgi:hypothetical protein